MTAVRDDSARVLVVVPPVTGGATTPADRHALAASVGLPAAWIARELAEGRPVVVGRHVGVAAARRQRDELVAAGVRAEVVAPGASLARTGGTALGLGLVGVSLLVGLVAWLLIGSLVLGGVMAGLGSALGALLVVLARRASGAPTIPNADARLAAQALSDARARSGGAWEALSTLEREVAVLDLSPDALADVWKGLDDAAEALLAGADPVEIQAMLARAREALQGRPAPASGVDSRLERAARAAAATREALRGR